MKNQAHAIRMRARCHSGITLGHTWPEVSFGTHCEVCGDGANEGNSKPSRQYIVLKDVSFGLQAEPGSPKEADSAIYRNADACKVETS